MPRVIYEQHSLRYKALRPKHSLFWDSARRALLDLLDSVRGRKVLVLESEFASPLGLVAEALTLKEHGVEIFSVLDGQPSVVDAFLDRGVRQVVYLVRSRMDSLRAMVRHVQLCQSVHPGAFEFTLLLVPRRSAVCERLLEEGGVLADVAVKEFPLELVVDHDRSSLFYVARALQQLQQQTGTIPHVKGKGDTACAVQRILARLRREQGRDVPAAAAPGEGIDTLILLDRSVDIVTPMCTQLTYEGLLDEVFSLNCGQLRVGEGAGAAAAAGRKVYGLNSADAVFRETRDQFYGGARRWLNATLRTIQEFRDQGMHTADITQLRGFVAELREKFVRIPLHTSLIEQLAAAFQRPAFVEAGLLDEADEMAAIEDLMLSGEPLLPLLRLLVLYCAVHGGVPRRHYEALRRDLLNTYGHQHLLTLGALGQADIHFAYAGYAPLSVRLVQQALAPGGWAAPDVAAAVAALPGQQFELLQTTDGAGLPVERRDASGSHGRGAGGAPPPRAGAGGEAAAAAAAAPATAAAAGQPRPRTVLVVFIGGVTHAEVSALRFLSRKGLVHADFVVAATSLCTGASLLRPLVAGGGGQAGGELPPAAPADA
eukprot:scaffold23.g4182.t1